MEFFGIPVGDPEQIRAAQERQEMQADAIRHDIDNLLESLTLEEVTTLRYIIRQMTHNEHYGPYLDGTLGAMLKYKFGVCGCGHNHEADLLAMHDTPVVPSPEQVEAYGSDAQAVAEHGEPFEPVNQAEFDAKLEEYNLRHPEPGEVTAGPGEYPFVCKGCGMLYQSIEDRMLRAADDCAGCVHKAKWG